MKTISKNGKTFKVHAFTGSFAGKLFHAAATSYMSFLLDSFWENLEKGKWENDTFQIFDNFLDKYHSFIDIGAWYGPTVLYGIQTAKHCYAIEPDPTAYRILLSNIALNKSMVRKITIFNGAITNKTGSASLSARLFFGDSMSTILKSGSAQIVQVPTLTFSDLIKKFKIKDCNFIKMDTEGAESVILPAMSSYIRSNHITMLISFHPQHYLNFDTDSNNILKITSLYDHVYDSKGIELNSIIIEQKLKKKKNFDLVLSNQVWNNT
jgi:FkbM family methyltransferase